MRLVMFHPADHPLERGWVGRIDGGHVTQLAAQTLQSFFTGGGSAREHAMYRLGAVTVLAPVLHPASVRIFEDATTFAFANPAAISGPGTAVRARSPSNSMLQGTLFLLPRVAAVIGGEGELAGFTLMAEWRDSRLTPPKDRDFALGLGPVVVTPDELELDALEAVVRVDGEEQLRSTFDRFDWRSAQAIADDGTRLYPGDLLAGPPLRGIEVPPGCEVELDVPAIGVLVQSVEPEVAL
jgi:Fumarylacetoacetate (FAA) hydrolase family